MREPLSRLLPIATGTWSNAGNALALEGNS